MYWVTSSRGEPLFWTGRCRTDASVYAMTVSAISPRHTTVSEYVIEAIADAADLDPLAFETPLYEIVDLEALDALFASEPRPTVQFSYDDRRVVVHPTGDVVVEETFYESPDAIPNA